MITLLSGGTGTPKLLDGLNSVEYFPSADVSVVTNVGDDLVLSGNLITPDTDSVLYTLSGDIDCETWYGLEGDTFRTHERLVELSAGTEELVPVQGEKRAGGLGKERSFSGRGEFMKLGDYDRALHIHRTSLLEEGKTLMEATQQIGETMGIDPAVLPVTNDPLSTYIVTETGESIHFQDFWVNRKGNVPVETVEYRGKDEASLSNEVKKALEDPVVIGPSNPVTSIGPMLVVEPFRDLLEDTFVLGIAPFVGDHVFSGPAGDLLRAEGYEASTRGWFEYLDCLDAVLIDEEDPTDFNCPVYRSNLTMDNAGDRENLARGTLDVVSAQTDAGTVLEGVRQDR